jgi:hypothetical protein
MAYYAIMRDPCYGNASKAITELESVVDNLREINTLLEREELWKNE